MLYFCTRNQEMMAGQLSWLERMIHNHEVPGSIPGPATKDELQKCSSFFVYVSMFVGRGCESLENSLVRYINLTVIQVSLKSQKNRKAMNSESSRQGSCFIVINSICIAQMYKLNIKYGDIKYHSNRQIFLFDKFRKPHIEKLLPSP